jgi:threonine dehydrogenase-like Zn-dependent dehydrogenase
MTSLTVKELGARPVVVKLKWPISARIGALSEWPLILIDLTTDEGIVGRSHLQPFAAHAMRYLIPALHDLGAMLKGRQVAPFDLYGDPGVDGGQGEAVRVPLAQGTLVKLPAGEDSALLPSLLTLSDVFCTGHHAAVKAGVSPRTSVTVIGDGAVGLCAVLAARRLGAERILLIGRHKERTDLGREFGATDVIPERGAEGIEKVRDLTGGDGSHTVLECVGTSQAIEMALGSVRDGGVASRVGAAQYTEVPMDFGTFFRNITLTGGVAPARAYIEELMPDILDGTIEPGRVFDRTIGLEETPDGYRAMASREALKVLIRP